MKPDKRGYFYRYERSGSRVRRIYVGKGRITQLLAQADELEADRKEQNALLRRQDELEDDRFRELDDLASALGRALLLVAGYHQHHRGEWRRSRARDIETIGGDAEDDRRLSPTGREVVEGG